MPLERPAQETQIVFPDVGTILLLNENILLVHHGIVRKHLHRFEPYAVQRFIFLRRDGKQLRKRNLERHRDVGVFGEDTIVFDLSDRKFPFEGFGFQGVIHGLNVGLEFLPHFFGRRYVADAAVRRGASSVRKPRTCGSDGRSAPQAHHPSPSPSQGMPPDRPRPYKVRLRE